MRPLAHPSSLRQLEAAAQRSNNLMLVGALGSGRLQLARYLACLLHCDATPDCATCALIEKGSHADTLLLQPNDKGTITIEMAHELQHQLTKTAYSSEGWRVVIIHEAGALSVPAQNALLKLVEEPPPRTLFVLTMTSAEAVLPTIRSRSTLVYVRPVPDSAALEAAFAATSPAELVALARGRAGWLLQALHNEELAREEQEHRAAAEQFWQADGFERLTLAESLAANPSLFAIIEWMTESARRSDQPAAALAALQQFWQDKGAQVNTKHALTRLAVNL